MRKQWILGSLFPPAPTLEPGDEANTEPTTLNTHRSCMIVQFTENTTPACMLCTEPATLNTHQSCMSYVQRIPPLLACMLCTEPATFNTA